MAKVDGATKFKIIRHIELPGIMPTAFRRAGEGGRAYQVWYYNSCYFTCAHCISTVAEIFRARCN